MTKWEQFVEFGADVIYDRAEGKAASIFGALLRTLSYLFKGIVKLRFFLYENRILRNQPLGCLVVVVGNITVGGTGKTPVVERFARNLTEKGRKVAILSRGYKSKKEPSYRKWWRWLTHQEETPPKIVSDGKEVFLNSEVAGDEPYMLAKNLPGVVVIVDKNRVKAGAYAIKKFGVDTLLLDDGFQYLPLKGRLNLLLIDATNPFGNGALLPRGILREPISHIRRASYVFITKASDEPDEALKAIVQEHNPGVEIVECCHRPQYLQEVHKENRLPLSALQGKQVACFSAIAMPESFEQLLEKQGATLVYKKRFLDHHRFSATEIDTLFKEAKQMEVDMIVTTEKDFVRFPDYFQSSIPFFYLRLEIGILRGADNFDAAVDRICFAQKTPAEMHSHSAS